MTALAVKHSNWILCCAWYFD